MAEPTNIISLADRLNDNRLLSVEQLLEEALADVRSGKLSGRKAILMVLDEGPNREHYTTRFRCCDLRCSEVVSFLHVMTSRFTDMLRGH